MTWHLLEGPDGTGKTTLARQLEQRGFRYEHADATDTLPKLAQRMAAIQHLDHVVWDRAHLGEAVHGPLDRDTSIDEGWWQLIEAFLMERDSWGHLMLHRYDVSENKPQRHAQLAQAFDLAARHSVLFWNSTNYWVKETYYSSWAERPDPEGLGGLNHSGYEYPMVWILGEQQNSNADVPWPFATRCGIKLVWPMIVDLKNTRVSNAWRAGATSANTSELRARWLDIGQPKVITLGHKAQVACWVANIPVSTSLTHPQYHLRFRAHEPEVYHSWLSMAILRAEKEYLRER